MSDSELFSLTRKNSENNTLNFLNDIEYSSSDDDIPFIIPSKRITIQWPNINKVDQLDINIEEIDSETSPHIIDQRSIEDEYEEIHDVFESINIKLRAVKINLLPGFVKSYFFNNVNNFIEFKMKIINKEKFYKEISVEYDMEQTRYSEHIFEKIFKFKLKQYNIQIFKILNLKIPINLNDTIEIYFSNRNIESGISQIILCNKSFEMLYKGGFQIIKEIEPLNIANNEWGCGIGYIQLFLQK